MLLVALLFCSVWGVAHPEDQWYLITESELGSIETSRKNSEAERRNWLSQVSELKTQAERLNGRAENLRTESENSNQQLRQERELNRKLTQSFNEYEADQSRLISRKDTRIVQLETENEQKDKVIFRLIAAVSTLALAVVGYIAFRVCRFLKIIPV
jgi:chromosome segregation ATPase